jgi:hypothetical protein
VVFDGKNPGVEAVLSHVSTSYQQPHTPEYIRVAELVHPAVVGRQSKRLLPKKFQKRLLPKKLRASSQPLLLLV